MSSLHPVIQHISERAHKAVPVRDGRKIGLVLYGGVMGGIRGAGAMIALENLGFAHAFDCVYTNSAGFAYASYLLTGATQLGTSIYYEDLAGWRFINPFRLWKVVDIDFLISVMQKSKRLAVENILLSPTKVFVALQNTTTTEVEYLEVHNEHADKYLDLMRAATSIPFLHPGSVSLHGKAYMDIPMYKSVPHISRAFEDGCTDVLVIANYSSQVTQSWSHDVRIFGIQPDSTWKLSRLESNTQVLRNACVQMGYHVCKIFGIEENINLDYVKL